MAVTRSALSFRTRPERILRMQYIPSSCLQPGRQALRWLHTQIPPPGMSRSIPRPKSTQSLPSIRARCTRFRFNSTKANNTPNPTPNLGSPESLSLSQRLKALSKEYGWTALGVYLALSALDFPFCFLAVQLLGPERVGMAEHAVIDTVRSLVHSLMPDLMQSQADADAARKAAAAEKGGKATIWTQLVLAYAVHKSLIFFRVPLTAAVLPKVVKTLRSYGWKVGRAKPQAVKPSSSTSS